MPILEFFVTPAGRATRVIAGIAVLSAGLLLGGWWLLLLLPGTMLAASGAFDLCPLAIFVKKSIVGSEFRASCAR